jgi:membrane associated rhomboid family serine protease
MIQAAVGFHCPECARGGSQRVVRARDLDRTDRPPLVVALIAVNVLVFVVQGTQVRADGMDLRTWGLLWGPAVQGGEWWRLVTSGFLHADLIHLGFNMYALWILGPVVERGVGAARFAIIYAAGLLGGALAVSLFDFTQPTLGASGAVLGLAGGIMALLMRRGVRITQTSLGGVVLINLLLPLLIPRISFWGHLGGVAGGFAAGWLVSHLATRSLEPGAGAGSLRSMAPTLAAGGGLLLALAVAAVVGPSALGN